MKIGCASDKGLLRPNNEDSFLVDEALGLFAVADGLGAHRAGQVASKMAVEAAAEYLRSRAEQLEGREAVRRALLEAFFAAHEQVRGGAAKHRDLRGMGTTLVLALVRGGVLYVSHVGDSRAYLIDGEGIRQLTADHSVAAQLARAGRLSPEEAATHELRHLLTQAVGSSPQIFPDLTELELKGGEKILLCSDGLTNVVADGEILEAVQRHEGDPQAACGDLVRLALERGGPDNVTVVLLEYEEP
jgi:protein phosphatase